VAGEEALQEAVRPVKRSIRLGYARLRLIWAALPKGIEVFAAPLPCPHGIDPASERAVTRRCG
jgi:hypothetical protein